MLPVGKPAKSAASQPESRVPAAGGGGIWTSTGVMPAVTSPAPEYWKLAVS